MYVCMWTYGERETGGQPAAWKRWQKPKKYFPITNLAIPTYGQLVNFSLQTGLC